MESKFHHNPTYPAADGKVRGASIVSLGVLTLQIPINPFFLYFFAYFRIYCFWPSTSRTHSFHLFCVALWIDSNIQYNVHASVHSRILDHKLRPTIVENYKRIRILDFRLVILGPTIVGNYKTHKQSSSWQKSMDESARSIVGNYCTACNKLFANRNAYHQHRTSAYLIGTACYALNTKNSELVASRRGNVSTAILRSTGCVRRGDHHNDCSWPYVQTCGIRTYPLYICTHPIVFAYPAFKCKNM